MCTAVSRSFEAMLAAKTSMKNSILQRHVQHSGIRQWTRSRREVTGQAFAGIFPGIFSAHRQGT